MRIWRLSNDMHMYRAQTLQAIPAYTYCVLLFLRARARTEDTKLGCWCSYEFKFNEWLRSGLDGAGGCCCLLARRALVVDHARARLLTAKNDFLFTRARAQVCSESIERASAFRD